MDMNKLKEAGTSVKIVPGPNGTSFDGEPQLKFVGEGGEDDGNYKAPVRDVSFSAYLVQGGAEQVKPATTGSTTVTCLYAGDHMENQSIGDAIAPGFVKTLEKQTFCGKRVPVIGRLRNDSEISIFEAKKYFSVEEEKKMAPNESRTESWKPIDNCRGEVHAKHKVLSSDDSGQGISSPASSIAAVNGSFRPAVSRGVTTSTPSSEASWNSRCSLLSNSSSMASAALKKSSTNEGYKKTWKWSIAGFGCTCPCSNKKAVETDDTVTENSRAPSLSNALSSTAVIDSPLSSIKYSCPGVGKRVLGRSIEKQRLDAFVENGSEISEINSTNGRGLKSLINAVDNQQSVISRQREQLQKLQRNNSSFRNYDRDGFGDSPIDKRINSCSVQKVSDGFSFPILFKSPRKSEEEPRPSLEVFASPFTATPDRDLQRRSELFSLDKLGVPRFGNNNNSDANNTNNAVEDGDDDKKSDSSSELFEIESLTTEGTCYPLRKRDSVDDTSSIQSGYPASFELGFQSSFLFGGIEEPVTPSAQSSCYEPSEASLDWSVSTRDIMDKGSSGNFYSDFEETKRRSVQKSELSGLGEATLKGGSKRRSRGFLGCISEKAVSVEEPTVPSHSTRYNYLQRGTYGLRNDSFGLPRGILQSEKWVTDINASSQRRSANSSIMIGKKSVSLSRH